jgi:DNA-binding NtrC family response regulator
MCKVSADGGAIPPSPSSPCDDRIGLVVLVGAARPAPFALVIDDEEPICRLIVTTLEELGIESAMFATAKSAIAAFDQRLPAIIFLDVALDQSDAIDVIKGLSEKRYGGIVQLMSGGRPWLLAAIKRMAVHYDLTLLPPMQKPVRDAMIREAVAAAGLAPKAPPLPVVQAGSDD